MITVATFGKLEEADLFKCHLEAHGIAAVIPDSSLVQMQPLYASPIGGIRVQVAADDAETARQLLRDAGAVHASDPDLICPVCHSSSVRVEQAGRLLSALSCLLLFAGLTLDGGVPASRKGRCRCSDCGHRWKRA